MISRGEEIRYDYLCGYGDSASFPWRSKKVVNVAEKDIQCNLDSYYWDVQLGGNDTTFSSRKQFQRNVMTQVRAVDLNSKFSQIGDPSSSTTSFSGCFNVGSVIASENYSRGKRSVCIQTYTFESASKKIRSDLSTKPDGNEFRILCDCEVSKEDTWKREVSVSVETFDVEMNYENRSNDEGQFDREISDELYDEKEGRKEERYSCYYCEKQFSEESGVINHYLGQQCCRRFEILEKKDINATICLRCVIFFLLYFQR